MARATGIRSSGDDRRSAVDGPTVPSTTKWPHPLKPSEYIKRQIHVSFPDDPTAVAARNITGVSTVIWGNDYPHAEGTFRHSQQFIADHFAGVPDDERTAIVGGTLGALLGFKAPIRV